MKLLSKLEIQQISNFNTSHLLVNSNIWAIKPIKLIPLVRSQTRKTIKFLTLEQKLINFKLSFFLPSPQYSIRLVSFAFLSFISLIRLEKGFRILKKNSKFSKNFTSFTHSPHQLFSKNFLSSNTLTTPILQKNYKSLSTTKNKKFAKFSKNFRKILLVSHIHPTKFFSKNFTSSITLTTPNSQTNFKSLPTSRNKNFEKFYKFSKRIPKKGHACIVRGGGEGTGPPPVTNQAFSLLLIGKDKNCIKICEIFVEMSRHFLDLT